MDRIESITTVAALNNGAERLAQICPDMARALACVGPLKTRQREDGFTPLMKTIVGQQISLSAASAIWARLETAGYTTANRIKTAEAEMLKDCGLSASKITYVKAIADHGVDFAALRSRSDDEIRATLLAIKGVGPWTVDIYLMFSLGRPDVMPAGDVALQSAAQSLLSLDARPKPAQLAEISTRWAPYRSVAAHILWAYYAYEKQREGI